MPLNKIDSAHFVYQAYCSNLKLSYTDPDEKYYYYWYIGQCYLWAIIIGSTIVWANKKESYSCKLSEADLLNIVSWSLYRV